MIYDKQQLSCDLGRPFLALLSSNFYDALAAVEAPPYSVKEMSRVLGMQMPGQTIENIVLRVLAHMNAGNAGSL